MDRPLQAEKDIVRLPLYSEDYNRQVPAGSRGFTDATIGTGRRIQPLHDSVLVNCWAEHDANGEWYIVKRPGIATASGDLSSSGLGGTKTNYKVHAVVSMQALPGFYCALITISGAANTHLVMWTDDGSGGVSDLGTLTVGFGYTEVGNPYYLSEISIGGYPGLAMAYNVSTSTTAYYYVSTSLTTLSGGTLTQITDVDFPGNQTPAVPCRGAFVQLNDHVFIMGRDGKVYNSDVGSISSWNIRGVQPASIDPDSGVGLAKYKQHIVAFGTNSMEFFEDAGLAPPGGPLQRTEQAFIKIGCVAGGLIHNLADTLYWVAAGETDTRGLYKLDQYTPVKLSGPAQAPIINNIDTNARLGSILLGGCQHIFITNMQNNSGVVITTPLLASEATFTPAGSETESYPPTVVDICSSLMCYNIDHKSWWWWTDENVPLLNIFVGSRSSAIDNTHSRIVLIKSTANVSATSGRTDWCIFSIQDAHITTSTFPEDTPVAYTDNNGTGTQKAVCVVIQMAPVEFHIESRKAINKIKLSADAMVKYSDDASTGNQLYFLYDRLDGQGTVFSRAISVPSVNHRYFINNCGMTRKLYLCFVCKTAMAFRAKAVELHVTQATG